MKQINFFEIPAVDFNRAVKFYETVFGIKLNIHECPQEKMAFFPSDFNINGAVSFAADFNPSADGPVIYFDAEGKLDEMLIDTKKAGGKILREKTKIDGGHGYFALIMDSEGNRIGLHSK